VFSDIADTGIPALIKHVHTITEVRRRHGIERLIRGVTHFVLDVAGYLVDVGTQVLSPFMCIRQHQLYAVNILLMSKTL